MTTERNVLAVIRTLEDDARLLACALAGAYAALEMEAPPATAALLEKHLPGSCHIKHDKGISNAAA